MRILVTGAAGQLGSDVFLVLEQNAGRHTKVGIDLVDMTSIYALSKNDLDISDPLQIQKVFSEIKPDVVYNCAAYTDVDGCESNKDKAFLINAEAPGFLARECRKYEAKLVHFSTDYVFNGEKNEPYTEEDLPDPINVYGESKLLGENKIKVSGCKFLIIRTSWLYGHRGKNFVKTIIKLAEESPVLKVVDDQVGSPTHTRDLAIKTLEVASAGTTGVFNITNSGQCSWNEFAKEVIRIKQFSDVTVEAITSLEVERPAKRPRYSVLSVQKLEDNGFTPPIDWRSALFYYLNLNQNGS